MSTKRTPEEMGQSLEDFAEAFSLEEEARRLPTRSRAEVEGEIAKSGIDRARARAIGERAAREAASVVRLDEKRAARASRLATWGPRLALAACVLLAVGYVWKSGVLETPPPVTSPRPDSLTLARELRASASVNCAHAQWSACLRRLDEAKGEDPAGDGDPAVQKERERALAGLAAQQADGGE